MDLDIEQRAPRRLWGFYLFWRTKGKSTSACAADYRLPFDLSTHGVTH